MKYAKGFTLIELVSVIIIVGILAVSTIGVFSEQEDFQAPVVKYQLLSTLRLAQQLALSRQNLSTAVPVTVTLNRTSDVWRLRVWDSDPSGVGNTPFSEAEVEQDNLTLAFSTADFATACNALSTATSFTITFDGDGNLLSSNQLRICVAGSEQICVTSLGFAYQGSTCL